MTISSTSKSSITSATTRLNPETLSSFTPTSSPWTCNPRRVRRLSSSVTSAIAMIVPPEVVILAVAIAPSLSSAMISIGIEGAPRHDYASCVFISSELDSHELQKIV
jgi:hypothetical protein